MANVPRQLMSQMHSGTRLVLLLPETSNTFMTLYIDPLQIFLKVHSWPITPKPGVVHRAQSLGPRTACPCRRGPSDFVSLLWNLRDNCSLLAQMNTSRIKAPGISILNRLDDRKICYRCPRLLQFSPRGAEAHNL